MAAIQHQQVVTPSKLRLILIKLTKILLLTNNYMIKKILMFSLLSIGLGFTGLVLANDYQTNLAKINFPIVELGNCRDQATCLHYCDQAENISPCLAFAEKNQLLSAADIALGKQVAKRIADGTMPGQCKSRQECESFCNGNTENLGACLSLAEELGVLSPADLQQAKKVLQALQAGAKLPGACTNKQTCENYCADNNHLDECLSFAVTAGFISQQEAEMAKQVGGAGPGNCRGTEECQAYCADPAHQEECFEFAKNKGLIEPQAVEAMKAGQQQMTDNLQSVPAEMRGAVEQEVSQVKNKYIQEQRAPTATEIEQIKQDMMKKYMPQDIPTGAGGPPPGF